MHVAQEKVTVAFRKIYEKQAESGNRQTKEETLTFEKIK